VLFFLVFTACHHSENVDNIRQGLLDSLAKVNPAITNISNQIKVHPENAELFYARGSIFFQMNQLALAAHDVDKAIHLDSLKVSYYLMFADINIAAGYVELALKNLKKAKKIAPDDRNLEYKLAKSYLYLKEYDAALGETNTILQVAPNDAPSLLLQGFVFKEKGDTIKALALLKQAADAEPQNYDVNMQLGLLNNFRNKKLAEKYFMNAVRIDSQRYEGNYALAMLYQNNNEFKKAISVYKKLILNDAQNPQPFYNLGALYFHLDSVMQAFKNFNLCVANAPSYAEGYFMRGLCWEIRKNKKEAAKDFQTAMNLKSNYQDAAIALKRVTEN
jgi:tetratricopeptide (TPR) repeat protein